ncbi:MAG: hypothetical protein L3J31_00665 [Bacteroidales bacterium]|nr:hypothetical protein [Bacteroidales bacterium]
MQLSVAAQVSKQDAIDLVMDSIAADRIDSVNIYMDTVVLSNDYYVISPYDSIDSPYSNYWLFFIDEHPFYMWGHLGTYVFIDQSNGDFTTVNYNLPPLYFQFKMEGINTPLMLPTTTPDFMSPYNVTATQENLHYYAVIFSGFGGNTESAFWNHLSHMYCALKEKGFSDENIYVLSGDGTAGSDYWQNPSLDLDNDLDDDIMSVPCSVAELNNVFQQLETSLTEDDLLFIFATTHGDQGTIEDDSYLILYQYEKLWDNILAEMIENINCSQIIIPIYACNSGGFVDDLMVQTNKAKRTVFTTVGWANGYARNIPFLNTYGMDVFPYFLITAFRGYHPLSKYVPWSQGYIIGEHPGNNDFPPLVENSDFDPDITLSQGNGDGVIQIGEVIYYTKEFDGGFNNFGVIAYDCGFNEDLLSLTGISGNVETTQTLEGSFIIGGNLNIKTGKTLTVDNESSLFLVNGSISTESGSTLNLQSVTQGGETTAVLVHNFSGGGNMSVVGNLLTGPKVKFSSENGTSLNMSVLSNVTFSDCVFDRVTLSGGTNTLTINQSSVFTNSLIQGSGHYIIDNSTFISSSVNLYPAGPLGCSANITNSSFTKPHPDIDKIVSLFWVDVFDITGNTFSNYTDQYNKDESSLFLEFCGDYGTSNNHDITGNTFNVSDNQTYSNTNGITLYSSVANIQNNNIQNQRTGIVLHGNSQTEIYGNQNAIQESQTQIIKNNTLYQVYASEYAFPNYFKYNAVYEDTYSNTYILHLVDMQSNPDNVYVKCNNWGLDTYPADNLYPTNHYLWDPIWTFSDCNTGQTAAAALYETGTEQVADSNYNAAQTTFEQVVTDYPESEEATNAMKDLYLTEPLIDSTDFAERQNWYLTEPAIFGNDRLKKIGENLANKCDEQLENYPDAIDWYEDVIDDPPTLQDSVFAIIDLENVYLQMGIDTTLRIAYIGRMPQYKPESIKAHQQHRDELLSLLLGNVNKKITEEKLPNDGNLTKPGELLQNVPNPFSSKTSIHFRVNTENVSTVELKIFSPLGKEIKQYAVQADEIDLGIVEINMDNTPQGIYYYSLFINGALVSTRKMMLIK